MEACKFIQLQWPGIFITPIIGNFELANKFNRLSSLIELLGEEVVVGTTVIQLPLLQEPWLVVGACSVL